MPDITKTLADALRDLVTKVRRDAPDLSGKLIGDCDAALALYDAAAVTQGAGTEEVDRLRDEAVKAFRAYGRQLDASHNRFAEHETERPDRCTVENAIRALALAARAAPAGEDR